MKKFRIISYLVELTIVSLLWPLMGGTIKNWWIVLIVTVIYHFATWDYSTRAINFPMEEGESSTGSLNARIFAWILILGIGVTGVMFALATLDWKHLALWMVWVLFCCYRLSKYFNKNDDSTEKNT